MLSLQFAELTNINNSDNNEDTYYNEELLFMISAMIIYYLTQTANLDGADKESKLYRRVSDYNGDKTMGKVYSDEERIENMAKYAYCTKNIVKDRIKTTVAHIKSQINKIEKISSQ